MQYVQPGTRHILSEWRKEALSTVRRYTFSYALDEGNLTIYSDRPGYLIGLHGSMFYKYKEKIMGDGHDIHEIIIREVQTS